MKVIALMGFIGCGKETASKYLSEQYGYRQFSMGTDGTIGNLTRKLGLPATRENLQNVSQEYREKYGMDYFAKLTLKEILDSKCEKALITEVRKSEDISIPRNHFGSNFIVLFIDSLPEIRFSRLLKRGLHRDPKSWEEFQKHEKREYELYFSKSIGMEDATISNNISLGELQKNIDKILKEKSFS